ncbi:MAG: isochorismatase family protein [Acidimicrobiia bacterium]|nr:isochorismatase family protein [Acidimicrobiia bacterium]
MTAFGPSTALVVVDVQNDFAHPDGTLFVAGAPTVIPIINATAATAVASNSPVIRTQDWHPPVTPHFASAGGIWPEHCVADSWGARFHDDLVADGPIVRKGVGGEDGYSGFTVRDPESGEESPTELETLLRERGIDRIVVVGLATDYCVKATAIDGARLGFGTTVIADGVAAVDLAPGDGARAVAAMVDAGVTIT